MRVLLTVPSLDPEFGGPTAKAHQLAASLRTHGADVIVAGCGGSHLQEDERTLALPAIGGFHSTPFLRATAPIRRLISRADIVHVLGFRDPVGTTAALVAARLGVPCLLEPVGMHRRRLRSQRLKRVFDRVVGDDLIGRAAVVVATSQIEARELQEDGIPQDRIALRANGVDVSALLPLPERGAFRHEFGIPPVVPLALALGRIARKKGALDVIEAVATDDVWLAIAGPDGGDGTLERIRTRLRAPDAQRVRLVPRGLWGRGKAAAFSDSDVFCLPSLSENFGTAAAEAAALGLPVLISDSTGVAEWLPNETSRVVRFHDVAGIRSGIRELLAPGVAAKADAFAEHLRLSLDWRSLAAEQLAIYERVLAARS